MLDCKFDAEEFRFFSCTGKNSKRIVTCDHRLKKVYSCIHLKNLSEKNPDKFTGRTLKNLFLRLICGRVLINDQNIRIYMRSMGLLEPFNIELKALFPRCWYVFYFSGISLVILACDSEFPNFFSAKLALIHAYLENRCSYMKYIYIKIIKKRKFYSVLLQNMEHRSVWIIKMVLIFVLISFELVPSGRSVICRTRTQPDVIHNFMHSKTWRRQ